MRGLVLLARSHPRQPREHRPNSLLRAQSVFGQRSAQRQAGARPAAACRRPHARAAGRVHRGGGFGRRRRRRHRGRHDGDRFRRRQPCHRPTRQSSARSRRQRRDLRPARAQEHVIDLRGVVATASSLRPASHPRHAVGRRFNMHAGHPCWFIERGVDGTGRQGHDDRQLFELRRGRLRQLCFGFGRRFQLGGAVSSSTELLLFRRRAEPDRKPT